jgi:uncharacterized protein (DUF433 family)
MTTVALEYIEIDDRGVAKLIGSRTKVRQIVIDTNAGRSPEWIVEQYPHLSLSQVHAALAYYYAHRPGIDAEIDAADQSVERLRATIPDRLTRAELEARWRERFPDRPLPSSDLEQDEV